MHNLRASTLRRAGALALITSVLLVSCAEDDAGSPDPGQDGVDELSPEEEAEQEHQQQLEAAQEEIDQWDAALAGPGEEHREQAAELVAEMGPEQKAGQVIIGEYQGTEAAAAAEQIEELDLAGMILMGHNIPGGEHSVDTQALAEQTGLLAAAGGEDRAVPPIISVDQEGGLVTRVGNPVAEWPTPMGYGAAHHSAQETEAEQEDEELILPSSTLTWQGHRLMAQDLHELGFTVSFAPNADVTHGAADPTIGSRSFGSDPQAVSELAVESIRGLAEGGVAGSVKHFPGHGSVSEDSHYTLPVQEQSLEQLRERDWVPFAESIEAGVPMVMMGHIDVPALEEGVPSSLSAAAYGEIRDMGHEGVVVTDAMNMAAIAQTYGGDQAVVDALAAGADLILMPESAPGAHSAILSAVDSGELEQQRLDEAAERVVALVLWQQELAAGELSAGPGVAPEHPLLEDQSQEIAEQMPTALTSQMVTLVEGQCEAELTEGGIQIQGGTQQDRDRLAAAAQEAGLETGWGTTVTLLGGTTPSSGDVVVTVDRPEALAESNAETKIALNGRSPESFEALIAVLTGAEAPGTLPVEVGEHPVGHSACQN